MLDKKPRGLIAEKIRDEDARYRSMPREDYLGTLPKSYRCGKCGATVAIDVEKMMQHGAELPACGCVASDRLAVEPISAQKWAQ